MLPHTVAQHQLHLRALEAVQAALSDDWGATWHRANAVRTLETALAKLRAAMPRGTSSRDQVVVCFKLRNDALELHVRWSDLSLGGVLAARPIKGQRRFGTVAHEVFRVARGTLAREQLMFKFARDVGSKLTSDGHADLVGEYGAPPRAVFPHKMGDLRGATGAQFADAYREAAGAGARAVPLSWARDVKRRLVGIVSADGARTFAPRGAKKRRAPTEPEEDEERPEEEQQQPLHPEPELQPELQLGPQPQVQPQVQRSPELQMAANVAPAREAGTRRSPAQARAHERATAVAQAVTTEDEALAHEHSARQGRLAAVEPADAALAKALAQAAAKAQLAEEEVRAARAELNALELAVAVREAERVGVDARIANPIEPGAREWAHLKALLADLRSTARKTLAARLAFIATHITLQELEIDPRRGEHETAARTWTLTLDEVMDTNAGVMDSELQQVYEREIAGGLRAIYAGHTVARSDATSGGKFGAAGFRNAAENPHPRNKVDAVRYSAEAQSEGGPSDEPHKGDATAAVLWGRVVHAMPAFAAMWTTTAQAWLQRMQKEAHDESFAGMRERVGPAGLLPSPLCPAPTLLGTLFTTLCTTPNTWTHLHLDATDGPVGNFISWWDDLPVGYTIPRHLGWFRLGSNVMFKTGRGAVLYIDAAVVPHATERVCPVKEGVKGVEGVKVASHNEAARWGVALFIKESVVRSHAKRDAESRARAHEHACEQKSTPMRR